MSRIYSRKPWARLLAARRLVAGLGILFALILLVVVARQDEPAPRDVSTDIATDTTSPITRILSEPVYALRSVGRSLSNYVVAHRRLGQVDKLQAELRLWRERAVKAESLVGNYEALLKIRPDSTHNYIGARVFGDMGGALHRHLLANLGRQDGVQVGQAALGPNGFVGHVIAAGTRTSRIMLVTDVKSHIAVLVGEASHRAIMSGDGSGHPFLEFVDDALALKDGETIVTSGHDGYIPAGLPVGVLIKDDERWRVRLWEQPWGLEHVRIAELPGLASPVYQELPLQLLP